MAKKGGGIGRVELAPSSKVLAENIDLVEQMSDQSTDGIFGSTKSGGRVSEIYSDDPHGEALRTAELLARGGSRRILKGKGWVSDFSDRSSVTYRYQTKTVKDMPGITLTIRDGATRAVYEIHYLQRTKND